MHILEHSNKYYNINSQRVVPNQQLECHHHLGIQLLLLFSHSVMSDSLRPHGLQHARLPCPSPSP